MSSRSSAHSADTNLDPGQPCPDELRHVLVPTVIEEGNRGDRAFDIYS